jgi:hypothetical protein
VLIYSIPLWVHPIYQSVRDSNWAAQGVRATVIHTPARTAAAMLLFLAILVMRADVSQDFVYFQF